jgi:hypothetical protein
MPVAHGKESLVALILENLVNNFVWESSKQQAASIVV